MNDTSITGHRLLFVAVLLGVLAMVFLTAVALSGATDQQDGFSIAMPVPYAKVADAVRVVCADGVIRGTAQYESETTLSGAEEGGSSTVFPRWAGPGEVFFKSRAKTVSPTNFAGSQDRGVVTVRYTAAHN